MRVAKNPSDDWRSPFRLVEGDERVVRALNAFLDHCAMRGLSPRSLRTYAFMSLHIGRWMETRSIVPAEITASHFWEFLEHLRAEHADTMRRPASINLAIGVMRALARDTVGNDPFPAATRGRFGGMCRPDSPPRGGSPVQPRMRVEKRIIRPLKKDEVRRFFAGLRTWRDIALTSLMLFSGLRFAEVLVIRIEDIDFERARIVIHGKGSKDRALPVDEKTLKTLAKYLTIERPKVEVDAVFLVLKGRRRGRPMTLAGLRSIFRYRRRRSNVAAANPHRFRHTFANDMVRSGLSLPALQRLLGHSNIQTTMRYVNLSAEEVRDEFDRATKTLGRSRADVTELQSDR
jgi:integrase/recombinase XerD